MARLLIVGAAAPLLLLCACAIPDAAPPPAEDPATQPEIVRQTRAPAHSPEYLDAVRDVLRFEEADVEAFERQVRQAPEDWTARAKILAYCLRSDQAGKPEGLERRKRHVFHLIDDDPESEILGSYLGRFQPGELTAGEEARARTLWEAAPRHGRTLSNAANFFLNRDRDLRRRYLELAAEAEPWNAAHGQALGEIYARDVIDAPRAGTPEALRLATRAEEALEATNNAALAQTAAYVLASEANHPMRQPPAARVTALAKRMAERARLLNPEVEESWINPTPPTKTYVYTPPTEEEIAKFKARVVRLSPSDFPELPAGIAALLAERGCGIPQISHSKQKDNLIRGEFFRAGEPGWAVICSKDGISQILVFRNDEDRDPYLLSEGEDAICMAEEWNCGSYMTAISAVGREFIVSHYRAYGGPEPPPIDHDGIDVAFVEKASSVRYFYQGEWLTLTGAD